MRFINTKNPDNPPVSLINGKTEQERIALSMDRDSITDTIFKGDKITINDTTDPYDEEEEYEVRYQLRLLFHNKCAYCECREYKPDVEHFRPKKRVTRDQRNAHGYYWLCYEWTNLLPACSACNSRSGKWDKFPIGGNRVTNPPLTTSGKLDFDKCKANRAYLLNELPLLLHPEIDEPTNFLQLEWNGQLTALDGQHGKGHASIDTYDLNRGNLIAARKEVIDNFKEGIYLLFNGFRQGFINASVLQTFLTIYLADFKDKNLPTTPYSFVFFYICEHFSSFVTDNFPDFEVEETQLLIESFPIEI